MRLATFHAFEDYSAHADTTASHKRARLRFHDAQIGLWFISANYPYQPRLRDTHTISSRPAAEPKGLLTLSDTTLLMLHRGLTSPCAFSDSLLHAACCPSQSPCLLQYLGCLFSTYLLSSSTRGLVLLVANWLRVSFSKRFPKCSASYLRRLKRCLLCDCTRLLMSWC